LPDVEPDRRERLYAGMPNPNAIVLEERNKWLLPLIAGAAALLVGVGVTWALVGGAPSQEQQDEIDALTQAARTAASKTRWVYPPDGEPSAATALRKIMALEELTGTAAKPGDDRAEELRVEFGDTLNSLGDRYWDSPGGEPFAREYYTMALLFNPDDAEAHERTGWTPAMLAEFRSRIETGEFTDAELSMARWLDVLAEEDEGEAKRRTEALLAMELEAAKTKDRSASSALVQSRALDAVRGAGIEVDATPGVPPPPVEDTDTDTGAEDGELEDSGETGEELVDEPDPKGGNGKRRPKSSKDDDEKLGSNARDPAKAAALAEEGVTALRAGKRGEAKTLFNQAISYDPRNAKALMGLSDVYFDTGSSQKAVLYAERAVKAAPKNSGYRIKLGDAYYNVLRYRDALDEYKKAKSLGSSKADKRIAKANAKIGG